MTGPSLDLSLYLVVGSDSVGGQDLVDLVAAAVDGGVSLVQLREKVMPNDQMIAFAVALRRRLAPLGVPLIINDRLDVALAADADGLHVGQDDLPPPVARQALGPGRILGLSAGTPEEARTVAGGVVDYAGVGPVYETGTKADAGPAIGIDGLRRVMGLVEVPVVAIGGIQITTAHAVGASGVAGIAVTSAICSAQDPRSAAEYLKREFALGRSANARISSG